VHLVGYFHNSIKGYWCSFDIFKGSDNTEAWEQVTVKCLNGMWCTLLPEFMHIFTQFESVENTVEDISRLVQEVGLYKVISEDVTELLDSHRQ
jgi:hypothetical protein